MPRHHFISYSNADAEEFAHKLARQLQAGPPPLPVWLDDVEIKPGQDWDDQIVDALRDCRTLLFVMTPDSVVPTSGCKKEWTRALKYKKPIIPLLLNAKAEMPFRLEPRQYIDFTGNFKTGLARLRNHLIWMDSPEGELHTLNERLADANRDLPRAKDANQRARVQDEIDDLTKQIAKQKRLVADPQGEAARTTNSIRAGLERERKPERPSTGKSRGKFINPPPFVPPTYFQNRHTEINLIGKFIQDPALRLLVIDGRGGVGKTALSVRVLKSLESGKLPNDGGPLAVDGIVYLSAVGGHRVNFPNLYADLCKLLPNEKAKTLDALNRDPHASTEAKMAALLEAFPTGRHLVLLDNFENLIDAQSREISDPELKDALTALLCLPHHGVKIIITTRVVPRGLALSQPSRQFGIELDKGLEKPYAENILREMDADGKLGVKHASNALLAKARERTRGFPRALEALYAILAADRNTTLAELLADTKEVLPKNVVQALVGEAFSRLDPLAQQVMEALSIYNRPVTPAAIDHLLQPHRPGIDSAPVLGRLVNMHFAHRESGRYYLHPVDRKFAISRIPVSPLSKLREGWGVRAALLARAADYFKKTRLPRAEWKNINDLAPQLHEFDLRCQAEDYDTAARVLTDIDFHYLLLWGHYRTMITMHERLQGKIQNLRLKANSVGNLGSANYSIGQYQAAIRCYEQALEIAREMENRGGEGNHLGNLGNAYAALGETQQAIEYYEKALGIAREIGDRRGEGNHLGNLGIAYADLGETRQAIEYYEKALEIAREIGDRRGEGNRLGNLGLAYADLGETRQAMEYYEKALKIRREIGDRRGEAKSLGGLGQNHRRSGDFARSLSYSMQALAIFRELGDCLSEGRELLFQGHTYFAMKDLHNATLCWQESLLIAEKVGDRLVAGNSSFMLAKVLACQGNLEQALNLAQKASAIYSQVGRPDWAEDARQLMTDIQAAMRQRR